MRWPAALTLSLCSLVARAADTWPQYGGPNGDFRVAAIRPSSTAGEWKRLLGPGTCGIVADGKRLYTMYAIPKDDKSCDEVAIALDPATGKTIWEESNPAKLLPKQETFGGRTIEPQATPAVFDGRLFTVGFTGVVHARDAATGKKIWSTDRVADHGATPVQFGFAASPIVRDGRLIVAVGGKHALIAFDPKTGTVEWKSEAAEPGYATPIATTWDNQPLIVVLGRDALFGFDAKTGTTRLKYALPKKGETNVPTPIVLDGGRLLVSGQGFEGTRLLQLQGTGDSLSVKELWHQRRAQFFYTNWVADAKAVYGFPGNGGKRFTALSVADGSILFQEASLTDANVLAIGSELLACRGDGLLAKLDVSTRAQPIIGRSWATPTILGDRIVVRAGTELAMVKLSSLVADFKPPMDGGVSALDAAFGPRPKKKAPVK